MKLKIAVATQGSKDLRDMVSEVFGKTRTFTIVEVEDGQIKDAKVFPRGCRSLGIFL